MPFLLEIRYFHIGNSCSERILNVWILFAVFFFAAVLGDTANYWIGYHFGKKVFAKSKLFNEEYLQRTEKFYEKHGGKTIFLARFVPIIRTFAPFVAGIGKMKYSNFIKYNIIGAFCWVILFLAAGYFFGNIPIVKNNLVIVTFLIIIISFIPPVVEYIKHKRQKSKEKKKYDVKRIVNK
jgi:membrane-associated protein